jgi:hypothetical protein
MDFWEISADCACHDPSAAPTCAAGGFPDGLQLPTVTVQDAAASGRYSDATATPDDNLKRCSIPEEPLQSYPYAHTARSVPEFAPCAQQASLSHAGSISAHDNQLAVIALSQLEALAVEALDQQGAHDGISASTDPCADDTLFRFLGGSHAQRNDRALESAFAATPPGTAAATSYSSARLVNSLPTAASEPGVVTLHQLQLPVQPHAAAGSIASLPPRLPGIVVGANRLPPHRGDEMMSLAGMPRPSAIAVERQLSSRLAGVKSSHERREWTAAEDLLIRSGVERFGTRWRRIADLLPTRSDDAVRNRWNRIKEAEAAEAVGRDPPYPASDSCGKDLSECSGSRPSLGPGSSNESLDDGASGKGEKKKAWTTAEDTFTVNSVETFGHKWNKIADGLPGRTDHAIRNRWQRLLTLEKEERHAGHRPEREGRGRTATAPAFEPAFEPRHALPPCLHFPSPSPSHQAYSTS